MSIQLSSSAYNINSMWGGIHDYNYDSNISLMASENTVGLYSSLPSQLLIISNLTLVDFRQEFMIREREMNVEEHYKMG